VDGSGCAIPALSVIPDLSLRGVNFRTNSAIITHQSKSILDNAAAALLGAPHINVEVQAHTDNLGDANYNDDLSYRRALAVRNYLERKGVSRERMEVQGYGERQPAFTNNTRMGRWQNRRVELLIVD
jgi:OOP family OmpA-OmpF porin